MLAATVNNNNKKKYKYAKAQRSYRSSRPQRKNYRAEKITKVCWMLAAAVEFFLAIQPIRILACLLVYVMVQEVQQVAKTRKLE